jgi:hypothetical protein
MRILINGLPLFGNRLANDLQSTDTKGHYHFVDTYYSKWGKIKFMLLLPFSDVVISLNGVHSKSGSLDWVLKLKKKLIMQGQGTDVSLAIAAHYAGTIYSNYISYANHFYDAPWFKQELLPLNILAEQVHFKYAMPNLTNRTKYKSIKVLTYIGQNRADFYGLSTIIAAATVLPEIEFNIMGMSSTPQVLPPNVNVLGWVSQERVALLLTECAIFARVIEHDGFSVSVMEALSFGAEVIWSYEMNNCHLANNETQLINKISVCKTQIEQRGFTPNYENINYVNTTFSKEVIMKKYINKIYEIANK